MKNNENMSTAETKIKYRALVTAEINRELLERHLQDKIDFTYAGYNLDHNVLPHDELVRQIGDYDILISEYDTVSAEVFEAAKRLRIIVCCRGGVKTVVDLDAAMRQGVVVCNNAGRNSGAVTDMTMGYILDLTRNITRTNNLIHSRKLVAEVSTKPSEYQDTVWGLDNDSPFIRYRGRSINHMSLGLIGFGHAGRLLAKKAHAFDMKILAYDPYSDFHEKPEYVANVTWDEVVSQSDIISLHCVLTPQTRNMFCAKVFSQMKDGAYFINTSRGELVVEEDLVAALQSGKLAGAAIDVTRQEPIPANSILVGAPNLLVTPHIAGSSDDVQHCGTIMVIDSLTDFLAGRKPSNCVVYR